MVVIGDYTLRGMGEVDNARTWYTKAIEWVKNVPKTDESLDAFRVPRKASAVTAPPHSEHTRDSWGNAVQSDISPVAMLNRMTCGWYPAKLEREAQLGLGFTNIMSGDGKAAENSFKCILELDASVARLNEQGWPNAYKRLMDDCERGYFWGWPEELAAFRGVRRVQVYLAGFYIEVNDYAQAEAIFKDLSRGRFGVLSKKEEAFVVQGIGECRYRNSDFEGATAHFRRVASDFKGTPTEPKAILSLANTLLYTPERSDEAYRHYRYLYRRFPRSEWGEKGLYYLGFVQAANGKSEGARNLRRFLKEYPDSIFCEAAEEMLAKSGKEGGEE